MFVFFWWLSRFLKYCTLSAYVYSCILYSFMFIYVLLIYFDTYTYDGQQAPLAHRSESKMLRKPSHNESECLENSTKGQFLQGKETSMLFLNLSALRRHLPSYTSAFQLSLFANVHDDGRSAIKSRCICNL